jgi:TonB family protein
MKIILLCARVLVLMLLVAGVDCLSPASALAQSGRKAITNPQPEYPDIARKLHLTGTVRVEVVIGVNGQIKDTKVIGGHPLLVNSTLNALKMWKFAPSREESTTVLEFSFTPQ